MKKLFIIFAVLAVGLGRRSPRHVLYGNCYNFSTDGKFDLKAWANGKWYEIQRYSNIFEDDTTCGSQVFFYDTSIAGFDVSISAKQSNGTVNLLQGRVDVVSTGDEISMTSKYPQDSAPSSFDIVATDINTYSVIYSCWQISNASLPEKQERLWILSRTTSLSNETLETARKSLVVGNQDIGVYLYDVSHEGC